MVNTIETLHSLGQSLWYDNIERRLLDNGELAALIKRGDIRGLTSNPSIFHNAIANSHDYDAELLPKARAGYRTKQIYESLVIKDICVAADLLRPLYDETKGGDGYVSLEVSPDLANYTEETLAEARRLWNTVARPNLMIKIPGTLAGLPAIRHALAAGVNVNVTLIFSLERYGLVMEAYLSGLEDRLVVGEDISSLASVASFFVSRMDSKVDKLLVQVIQNGGEKAEIAKEIQGKLAIANAKLAYQKFRQVFEGTRYASIREQGGRVQRPLWASTSTKNPSYPDTLYVDELIGRHTVNTLPPQTLSAFRDHGNPKLSVESQLQEAHLTFDKLAEVGISYALVTQELEEEGVKAFSDAYQALIKTIEERSKAE